MTAAAVSYVRCLAGTGGLNDSARADGSSTSSSAAMRSLCAADESGAAKSLLLLGAGPEQRAEVDSWLGFASSFSSKHLASVDRHLHGRSFLAGNDFSLADIAIFFASASTVADAVAADATSARKTLDFSRWFNQVQHRVRLMAPSCEVIPPVVPLNLFTPVPISLPLPPKASTSPTSAKVGKDEASLASSSSRGTSPGDKEAKPLSNGSADNAASGKAGSSSKKDKKSKKKGADRDSKGGAVEGASTGTPAQAAAAAPAVVEGDPSKLDVRVGVIVKAWEHPDSEKLFCEEIDLGEGKTRNIASGLRAFYKLEEMQGRRVIVLANLKARNIGGFKSEGMVLCASSADHSLVKIIEPPPGAAIGARATVSGTEGEPATPAQVQKKKVLEKCAPKLRTNSDGVAGYDGVGVFNVDGEPCVATIAEAIVA